MKKKIVIITLSMLLVFVLVIGGAYASKNISFFQWGEQMAKIREDRTTTATTVAKVNGTEISKEKFDSYKAGLANASGEFTDEQILDKLIQQEVIMQEITRLGYTVTSDEVNDFNEERFSLLNDDPAAYQVVKDYVDGLGITMDEYKEMSKDISKTALLTNKYKADMMKEFEKQNSDIKTYSRNEKIERFEEYFNDKIEELNKNADVEIVK